MTDEEFSRIYQFVKSRYGLNVENRKELVTVRLENYVRNAGYPSYNAYMDAVEADYTRRLERDLVNMLMTNHTYFMREPEQFDFLRKVVLPWAYGYAVEKKEISIWCGACSTGEEAYTIAMVMSEFFALEHDHWATRVFATDISTDALQQAIEGIYTKDEVSKLPDAWRRRFFYRCQDGEHYVVKKELEQNVIFHKLNLMDPFPFGHQMHAIFLRNVMIYFDVPTRYQLMQRVYDMLQPGGYLFIGMTETLDVSGLPFETVKPSVFRKPPQKRIL
jgi:chemotaxis protein methyltransferase CheR